MSSKNGLQLPYHSNGCSVSHVVTLPKNWRNNRSVIIKYCHVSNSNRSTPMICLGPVGMSSAANVSFGSEGPVAAHVSQALFFDLRSDAWPIYVFSC